MGEMVEFASNGNTASGYLVTPARGGPGVLVIQEWWGLDSALKEVTDRLGSAGFVAARLPTCTTASWPGTTRWTRRPSSCRACRRTAPRRT